jgi:HPt (histidine-containing phosphotransfer) domain-containing protein
MNSLRFLLVHSNLQQAERIAAVLAGANHTVLPAAGLDEASDALGIEQFDAVLLESEFTRRGLTEFSAKLRGMEESRRLSTRVPIIAIDAANGSSAEAGFDAVMPQPIDPYALTDAVGRLAKAVSFSHSSQEADEADGMEIINPEMFEEQMGGDRELMVEIIDLFLEERKRQEIEMREALQAREFELLSRLAHTIKGSLGSLHASKSRYHAQELETASKHGDTEKLGSLLTSLEKDLAELEPELLSLRLVAAE